MEQGAWDRVKRVFGCALELPAGERSTFLDQECNENKAMRREVDELLAAHDEAAGRLGDDVESEGPGTRIGPYKLLQKIGEGGFGEVYMAEQKEPLRRRVALKIIKLGMDTKQVIARFEAERQALAMMDHPGIAKVLDAGSTGTGRPYFVMELVAGVPITEFCDQNHFNTDQRLDLFMQVCRAIQHAHQKGIIHRDLKPTNVLVAMHDGLPLAKVIDFGIAKATSGDLTDKTLFTEFHQFIGTPQYMSPEQATLGGLDVDTRSDIYSLGVLLYEMLTGEPPVDARRLREVAFDEVKRIISEEEPLRPSTRLSTLGDDLANVARARLQDPNQLLRSLRGDLDWIVLKALEKDRGRRYATANELIADIVHLRMHEPVTASPPTLAYRARKFIRRNRSPVVVGSALVLVLVLGILATSAAMVEARKGREVAHQNAMLAAQEAKKHRAVAEFLRDVLASVAPGSSRGLGGVGSVEDLLDQAAARLEASDLVDQPTTYATVAIALAEAFDGLWLLDKSVGMATQALEILEDGQQAPYVYSAAVAMLVGNHGRPQADAARLTGRLDAMYRRALSLLEPGLDQRDPEALRQLLSWTILLPTRAPGDGELAARRLLSLLDGMHDPPILRTTVELNLGTALLWQGCEEEARLQYRIVGDLLREQLQQDEIDKLVRFTKEGKEPDGQLFVDAVGHDTVVRIAERILEVAPRDHWTANAVEDLAWTLITIPIEGDDLIVFKPHRDQALSLLREALKIHRETLGPDHPVIGECLFVIANCLGPEDYSEKVETYQEAQRQWESTPGAQEGYYEACALLAATHLAFIRETAGVRESVEAKLKEADRLTERAFEWAVTVPEEEDSIWSILSRANAARLLAETYREWEEATPGQGYAQRDQLWRDRHRSVIPLVVARASRPGAPACAMNSAAMSLLTIEPPEERDPEKARRLIRRAVKRTRERYPLFLDTLALAEFQCGDLQRAVEVQSKAIALIAEDDEFGIPFRERFADYEAALKNQER